MMGRWIKIMATDMEISKLNQNMTWEVKTKIIINNSSNNKHQNKYDGYLNYICKETKQGDPISPF